MSRTSYHRDVKKQLTLSDQYTSRVEPCSMSEWCRVSSRFLSVVSGLVKRIANPGRDKKLSLVRTHM